MAKAIWNNTVIAEVPTEKCEVVEGNLYFPIDAIKAEYFKPSHTQTICPWKGTASYYNLVVNDRTNQDAAWYYPDPKAAAKNITGFIAFWKGVKVEK
jgi:uncharacterized protein (DUF427 family)